MTIVHLLPFAAVACGAAAAAFWWLSSWTALRPRRRPAGLGGAGTAVQQLGDTLRRQCAWHAAACVMAGAAALLQTLSIAMTLPA